MKFWVTSPVKRILTSESVRRGKGIMGKILEEGCQCEISFRNRSMEEKKTACKEVEKEPVFGRTILPNKQ
jgi:hypothetical protein